MNIYTRISSVLFLGLAVACGGTSFSSGVDSSKKVSELDDADATKICEAAEKTATDFAKDNKEGLCKFSGGIAGGLAGAFGQDPATACQMAVDDCLTKDATTETGECMPKVADCDATVEEMEACYNDTLDAMNELFGEFASKECAELVMDSSESTLNLTAPASCTSLAQKCPSLNYGVPSVGTSSTAG